MPWVQSTDCCQQGGDLSTRIMSYFLDPGSLQQSREKRQPKPRGTPAGPGATLVVIPNAGVLVHEAATAGAKALVRCLADVTSRLTSEDVVDPLTAAEEKQLIDWDAEKYRQSLDRWSR